MRKYIFAITLLLLVKNIVAQNVGIGTTTPNISAQLDVTSTTKGVLIPRMTDAEKNAIPSPVPGLLVYNTNTNSFQYYHGANWINISHSGIINGTPNKVAKFNSPWGLAANGLITDNGAGVAINTTNALPNSSALLDMTSTGKGILIPRMLSTERTAIVSPATGLMVYDNTTNSFWFYNGTVWTDFNGSGSSNWSVLGNNIYNSNAGNVGIGASTPFEKLTVDGNIVSSGGIGIGTATPDLTNFKLYVNGSARIVNSLAINDPFPDYNLDVNGTAAIELLGVGTGPQAGKALTVTGDAEFNNNLHVDGTTTLDGAVSTLSTVTVNNGKGVAYNANAATNLRLYRFTTANFHAILGPHASATTTIAFGGGFTSTPYVIVGDIESTGGTLGELDRVILVLRGCILDTNTGVTTCNAKIINTDNASVDYNITWNCLAIGY